MEHHIRVVRDIGGQREPHAEAFSQRAALVGDVDQRHLGAGQPGTQVTDQQPDDAAADHHDMVGRRGAGVPQRVEGGFHVGGERRPAHRQPVGERRRHRGRRDKAVLVWVQHEHRPAHEVGATAFDDAGRA